MKQKTSSASNIVYSSDTGHLSNPNDFCKLVRFYIDHGEHGIHDGAIIMNIMFRQGKVLNGLYSKCVLFWIYIYVLAVVCVLLLV